MPKQSVPVTVNIPAHGTVEIEAISLKDACIKVQADIDANGFLSEAGEAEFTSDWEKAFGLTVGDVLLPDGTVFSLSN
ncbi:hypothetical protein [Bythopirellula goksoeyrii]|uniref:Uncharacterized protein n=1 Tax=Bythopirellula goksoeyrii TaxID=1400387 RepID=A0A5B9QQK2_9BACT|nr:hypothetical protein [Bythopirellula goksoeyrii]QEG36243.1 hypothetical protein Pr1d_35550 [Bythopirellula goksoeyrii]